MQHLPDALIQRISQSLTSNDIFRLAQTCRNLRRFVREGQLEIGCLQARTAMEHKSLVNYLKLFKSSRKIEITASRPIKLQSVRTLLKSILTTKVSHHCCHLCVVGVPLNDALVRVLLKSLRTMPLVTLDLRGAFTEVTRIPQYRESVGFHTLETLIIEAPLRHASSVERLLGHFTPLSDRCPKLSRLVFDFRDTNPHYAPTRASLYNTSIENLLGTEPHTELRHLSLGGVNVSLQSEDPDDTSVVQRFVRQLPQLRVLKLASVATRMVNQRDDANPENNIAAAVGTHCLEELSLLHTSVPRVTRQRFDVSLPQLRLIEYTNSCSLSKEALLSMVGQQSDVRDLKLDLSNSSLLNGQVDTQLVQYILHQYYREEQDTADSEQLLKRANLSIRTDGCRSVLRSWRTLMGRQWLKHKPDIVGQRPSKKHGTEDEDAAYRSNEEVSDNDSDNLCDSSDHSTHASDGEVQRHRYFRRRAAQDGISESAEYKLDVLTGRIGRESSQRKRRRIRSHRR
ncbi:MAG: hypothetical protein MHM6MM_000808 [Cercozoa sp. M6MM]